MGELHSQQATHESITLQTRRFSPTELDRRILVTGRLREVHYWVTASGWFGPWRFNPRVGGIYLLSSNGQYLRPNSGNGYYDSVVGLNVAVTAGQLAEMRLIQDGNGQMTGPQRLIWVIEEGV